MKPPTTVTATEYEHATEAYSGWCTECEDFTRESTEPDAEDYPCPVCGHSSVMGAEQALLMGEITFGGEG
jgi:Zn finger protein HypA/HybF involved in hydrogenase expression